MSRWKRKGLIIIQYKYDHRPDHVHIMKGKKEIMKFDFETWQVMSGKMTKKIKKILLELREEGKI
ncbi:MAG: DUF4160 domain-containing protein [bacterium]|nr:DUF4160 domain-containing protein [bacterium]MBU1917286.1 DUF4160 domain-containing protein [bacterium]